MKSRAGGTDDVLAALSSGAGRRARRLARPPAWLAPMLATLTGEPFSDPAWVFERKLDGERCLAFRTAGGRFSLLSRNRKDLGGHYAEIAAALARAAGPGDFVLDGEVVAFEGEQTSFEKLQQRIGLTGEAARATGVKVFYYVFDLLAVGGWDLRGVPLLERKAALKKLFAFREPVRYLEHRAGDGVAYYRDACRRGWEGLIAKRADGVYEGKRSQLWLKFKCVREQEFVIGGFSEPRGSRVGFGALLVGYYDGGRLRYAGKVGTGYDVALLTALTPRLKRLERATSPFDEAVKEKGAHWLRPALVAQVAFTEWTAGAKLRHPRFLGLREDKAAREVVKEG